MNQKMTDFGPEKFSSADELFEFLMSNVTDDNPTHPLTLFIKENLDGYSRTDTKISELFGSATQSVQTMFKAGYLSPIDQAQSVLWDEMRKRVLSSFGKDEMYSTDLSEGHAIAMIAAVDMNTESLRQRFNEDQHDVSLETDFQDANDPLTKGFTYIRQILVPEMTRIFAKNFGMTVSEFQDQISARKQEWAQKFEDGLTVIAEAERAGRKVTAEERRSMMLPELFVPNSLREKVSEPLIEA